MYRSTLLPLFEYIEQDLKSSNTHQLENNFAESEMKCAINKTITINYIIINKEIISYTYNNQKWYIVLLLRILR